MEILQYPSRHGAIPECFSCLCCKYFEAMRQRLVSGHYNSEFDKDNFNHAESLDYFFLNNFHVFDINEKDVITNEMEK